MSMVNVESVEKRLLKSQEKNVMYDFLQKKLTFMLHSLTKCFAIDVKRMSFRWESFVHAHIICPFGVISF